jgi:hypothetical protein
MKEHENSQEFEGTCTLSVETLLEKFNLKNIEFYTEPSGKVYFTKPDNIATKIGESTLKECQIEFKVVSDDKKIQIDLQAKPLQNSKKEYLNLKKTARNQMLEKISKFLLFFGLIVAVVWLVTKIYCAWFKSTISMVEWINVVSGSFLKYLYVPSFGI